MKKLGSMITAIAIMAFSFGFSVVALNRPVEAKIGCSGANCATEGVNNVHNGTIEENALENTVKTIINVVIYVVGLVAVVMVILGGVQYTTSQGDAGKVKKAKDTILYGIIGLVVAILAFAVVNFVLSNVF